jgi:hypothetical protein
LLGFEKSQEFESNDEVEEKRVGKENFGQIQRNFEGV